MLVPIPNRQLNTCLLVDECTWTLLIYIFDNPVLFLFVPSYSLYRVDFDASESDTFVDLRQQYLKDWLTHVVLRASVQPPTTAIICNSSSSTINSASSSAGQGQQWLGESVEFRRAVRKFLCK